MTAKKKLTKAQRSKIAKDSYAARKAAKEAAATATAEETESFVEIKAEPKRATDEVVHIHFVADGMVAFGQPWFRGQEISMVVGDEQWKSTLDRNGETWIRMTADEQIDKYGEEKFRPGPWRGKTVEFVTDDQYREALRSGDNEKIDLYEKQRVDMANRRSSGQPPKLLVSN